MGGRAGAVSVTVLRLMRLVPAARRAANRRPDPDGRKTIRFFVISERGAAIAVSLQTPMMATGGQDALVQINPFDQTCRPGYCLDPARNTVRVPGNWEGLPAGLNRRALPNSTP
jgi:hypothetical protein